jgi:Zn-dependent membrane protease YugP
MAAEFQLCLAGAAYRSEDKGHDMPILIAFAVALLLVAIFGPQFWIRRVLAQHGAQRADLPGSGGELARHLLDEAGLQTVTVETTDDGDHYDPDARAVRLLPQHHDGRSIAAVAVAAHEVAHAVQHAHGERGFQLRLDLVKNLTWIDRLAGIVLLLAPLVFMVIKAPILLILQIVAGVLLLCIRIAVHVVTLPVEFDASFTKALPVLKHGNYLSALDMPAATSVLRAAAFTYVAAALATLLDIARWFRILRF